MTLSAQQEVEVCPVRLAAAYLLFRTLGYAQRLAHEDGSPLTRFQFQAVLNCCLQILGLRCCKCGTHSFRIGVATCAATSRLPAAAIQELGRWKSAAYRSYVRPDKV